jgi:hypothetical protein
MKKNVIILLAMVLSFTGCSHSFSSIEPNEVEKIIIWTHQSERELSKDNCVKIINQYNESVYGGEATGEGGTPDFGIIIFNQNSQVISVNDFHGKLEVLTQNSTFYLENEDLYSLIKALSELS